MADKTTGVAMLVVSCLLVWAAMQLTSHGAILAVGVGAGVLLAQGVCALLPNPESRS